MQFVPDLSALSLLPTGTKGKTKQKKKKKKSRLGGMRYLGKDSALAEKHDDAMHAEAVEMYDEMTAKERWEWMQSVGNAVPGSRGRDYELQRIKEMFGEWGVSDPDEGAEPSHASPAPTEVANSDDEDGDVERRDLPDSA